MNSGFEAQNVKIYVDHTHLGRHVTGLERITLELFARDSLSPLRLTPLGASGTADLIVRQNVVLPARMAFDRTALMLCPGFPPSFALSAFGGRVIPYIHDLFLMTRGDDLNRRAKLYMAPPFRRAVATLPRFLVNSRYTRDELRKFCRQDAEILLYRPAVRNVFGLNDDGRTGDVRETGPLRLIALGTVEPRKNLLAAAAIIEALRANGHEGARLDIIGRFGWGEEIELLKNSAGVTLHGYQSIEKTRELMARADLFINTSHDEGLGLPLLEAQYAGLPVIAPDAPVFREVLTSGGVLIDPASPLEAAQKISALVTGEGWRTRFREQAADNLARWNEAAEADRQDLVAKLAAIASQSA